MPHHAPRLSLALISAAVTLTVGAPARAQQPRTPTMQQRAAQQAASQRSATPALTVVAVNTTAAADSARGAKRRDTSVRPGDVLRYTLTFDNRGPRSVRNVELRNPIPSGVHFVPGSTHASRADARLEFSADNGRSWAARPVETVVVERRQVTRPVPADRFTHIRWVIPGTLAPKAVVRGAFEVRVTAAD